MRDQEVNDRDRPSPIQPDMQISRIRLGLGICNQRVIRGKKRRPGP
jgi:hypothetical protein